MKIRKSILHSLLNINKLYNQVDEYKNSSLFPPGHFYSPIVSKNEIKSRESEIWKVFKKGIDGINLNDAEQLNLLNDFSNRFVAEMPFLDEKNSKHRYYFNNNFYSYTDGLILFFMMRFHQPKKIIEVGSGFSSALMMDTNDLFFNKKIELTFIEPYPDRLYSLMSQEDKRVNKVHTDFVQSIDPAGFKKLNSGDILFIDSSHVAKTGSDVNYILFDILPQLNSGVLIHFHDIFYPFEYPKDWVLEGRNWNETYILKAFLMYNSEFAIKFYSDFVHKCYPESFSYIPLSYKNTGGNLWLEKV
jgi:hypothetical protein